MLTEFEAADSVWDWLTGEGHLDSVEWNGGLEWWNGLDWNGGMDWTGMVDWNGMVLR